MTERDYESSWSAVGGAGLAAALDRRESEASVLILEAGEKAAAAAR